MRNSYHVAIAIMLLLLLAFPYGAISGTHSSHTQDEWGFDQTERSLLQKVKLFAVASMPLGEFGRSEPNAPSSGYAYPGVGAGVEFAQEVFQHVGFAVTGMFVVHGYDVSGWKELIPYWHWEGDSRVVYALTGGLLYDRDISPFVNIYGTAQIGMLHVNYPNLLLEDQLGEHATLLADSRFTTGYLLTLGTTVKRFDASVRFMYGEPEYQAAYTYRTVTTVFPNEKLPVRAVMATLGVILN